MLFSAASFGAFHVLASSTEGRSLGCVVAQPTRVMAAIASISTRNLRIRLFISILLPFIPPPVLLPGPAVRLFVLAKSRITGRYQTHIQKPVIPASTNNLPVFRNEPPVQRHQAQARHQLPHPRPKRPVLPVETAAEYAGRGHPSPCECLSPGYALSRLPA